MVARCGGSRSCSSSWPERRGPAASASTIEGPIQITYSADSDAPGGGARVHDFGAGPLELMAGTNYDTTPEPASSLSLDEPLFTHYGIHVGVRYPVGRFRVGASYTHYWYIVPTASDSVTLPPTNVTGHGDNHIMTLSVEASL